jgi:sugar/nucleoside kinase (ribokinase family)
MSFPEEYAMVSYPGIRETFRVEDVDFDYVKSARHLHMSGYYLLRSMQAGASRLFREAKEAGMSTSLDPDHDPSGKWNGGMRELLCYVDFFFPNEHECMNIAGAANLDAAANCLRSLAGVTVIKRGAEGAVLVSAGCTISTPAFAITPVDTTGAGDSFNAGYLFQYLRGSPQEQCLLWGNACGALSTQSLGGTEGFPHPGEVERFLADRGAEGGTVRNA